jgi:hypothetical protein
MRIKIRLILLCLIICFFLIGCNTNHKTTKEKSVCASFRAPTGNPVLICGTSACEDLNQPYRDSCIHQHAMGYENLDLCQKIINQSMQDLCLNNINDIKNSSIELDVVINTENITVTR